MLSHAVVNLLMGNSVNAIRRVGTLLQDMAKKKSRGGKKGGRHAQKIQVVLQNNEQDLKRNAEGRTARVTETSSKTGSVLRYS